MGLNRVGTGDLKTPIHRFTRGRLVWRPGFRFRRPTRVLTSISQDAKSKSKSWKVASFLDRDLLKFSKFENFQNLKIFRQRK